MSEPIIKVENLSKSFMISHQERERYTSLRDVVSKKAKNLFLGSKGLLASGLNEEFWALKDVNFEIRQGDRVGIIGRNGAGKSTLLKILSRITDPTKGRVEINGRVASLLEVGTGFHPELTGRENIFLNGAILGMSRAEIKSKFDEIVAFAEVEQFLDTPVKRYSSGMYVRLAFAVAAHLEPDILIVDEVLAVGDAQFQKKCLGKMQEVSNNDGRTVIFVSHNIGAIKSLCNTSIILHKGEKILQGEVFESLKKYLSFDQKESDSNTKFVRDLTPTNKLVYVQTAQLIDDQKSELFHLNLVLGVNSLIKTRIGVNIRLKDGMGFSVAYGCSHYFIPELYSLNEGLNEIRIVSWNLPLAAGKYKIGLELVVPGVEFYDSLEDCIQFELSNESIASRNFGVVQDWGFGSMEIKMNNIL